MKVFQFLAKRGQHDQVARLLTKNFGKPRLRPYHGPRGEGVMISLVLPEGVSKRQVDRFLHAANVPGSQSRRNRFLVVRWTGDLYSIKEKVQYDPFILAIEGKLRRARIILAGGCECCGTWDELSYNKDR